MTATVDGEDKTQRDDQNFSDTCSDIFHEAELETCGQAENHAR
jgi:hypothetical protein